MKKCTRCGAENPDNRMWCISCKKSLLDSPREPVNADLSSEESDLRGDLGKQASHNEETVGGVGNHASGIPHWEETDNEQSSRLGGSLGKNRSGKSPDVTYCTSCGRPVPKVALYCPYCGRRKEGAEPTDFSPRRRPRKIWRWVSLLVALSVLVGLIGCIPISVPFSFKKKEDTKAAVSPETTEQQQHVGSAKHCYQIFHDALPWQEAKKACEAMGGHLATITSADEQTVLEKLNALNENLWIGASCDGNGNWSWVTGEQWSYTNWNDGEPNNSSNVLPNENCAALWPKGWNDLANDNLYEQSGYICEWDSTDATVIQEPLPGWFYCITVGGRADWKIMPENDGSFHSICVVWDWGDNGQGYSNGTGYITGVTGVFSEVEKVNGYSYRMVADKIRKTQEAGDTYLSGDARYVVEEGTGITEGSEFYLFLPGTPRSELPQGLIDSVNNNGFHSMDEITPDTYILYNPIPDSNGYDLVFISTPEEHNLQSQGAAAADRRLTSLTTYSQDGSIWYHHVFSWDENGNLIQVQEVEDPENIKSWTLQYNAQGQLLRENFSSESYSCVNRQYTYDPNGKMLTGRVATEDGYGMLETTYHYDSSGRIFKIIQTDDYSRRETTVTDFNSQGKPTRREVVETVLSTGAQTYATEHLKYDNLGREIAWSYSGSDGEYSTTYRYDIKPFVVCTDAKGAYTLILNDADGDSCWTIDVGCNYTPLDNGVIDFQNMDADTGTLEVDQEGYLTRISFSNGEYFEFEYSSSSQSGAE